jgi:hypothetical protein
VEVHVDGAINGVMLAGFTRRVVRINVTSVTRSRRHEIES